MNSLEFNLLLAGMVLYAISFVSGGILRWAALSLYAMIGGLAFQLASASVRWADIGHPPIYGTYEASLAGSWFLLIYTALSYRSIHDHFKKLVLTTIPIALLLLVYGFYIGTVKNPLTISERSLWVYFHALFSWVAFGSYTVSFCLALVYFWRGRGGVTPPLQDPGILDDLVFRYINFGFINHTVMFILGSYFSSILYGTWWQWDPAESTSIITWLVYGLAIHMRLFYGWKGNRGAILTVIAFLTVIVSYWGLIYFPRGSTYHIFDVEYLQHL